MAVAPAGPPVISSLSPASGAAGQTVMVSGANFLSTSGQIVATFNGQVAPTSCPAQNTCTVTVPSSTAPSAQVVITTAGRHVQCGDLHLRLSAPQQLVDLLVRGRGEVGVPLAHGKERIRAGHAEHVVADVLEHRAPPLSGATGTASTIRDAPCARGHAAGGARAVEPVAIPSSTMTTQRPCEIEPGSDFAIAQARR